MVEGRLRDIVVEVVGGKLESLAAGWRWRRAVGQLESCGLAPKCLMERKNAKY